MYKQTILREYFTAYLKAMITSLNNRVFSGRIDPKHKGDIFPFLLVNTNNDSIEERYTSHTVRSLDLVVQITMKDNQDSDIDFDALIEDLMENVETAMSYINTISSEYIPANHDNFRLFENVYLENTNKIKNNESGSDIGYAILKYKIEYEYEDPITPLTLNDFDYEDSIAHIQLINKGVPIND